MSSHAEAGGSGRLEEDPVEAANHYFNYLNEHQLRVQGGGNGTNPDSGTSTSTDTTLESGNDVVVASKALKKKRIRRPNELGIGQISGAPCVHFLAKVMPKISVFFRMTCARS